MKTLLKYTNQDLTYFKLKTFKPEGYSSPVLPFSEIYFGCPDQVKTWGQLSRLISKKSVRAFHTSNLSRIANIKIKYPLVHKKDKLISNKPSGLLTIRSKPIAVSLTNLTNTVYWNPVLGTNSFSLNDYQYIKCKWLFELLIGGFIVLHKDFGLIMCPIFLYSYENELCGRTLPAPSIYSSNWTNELLGDYSRIYYSVLTPRETRLRPRLSR